MLEWSAQIFSRLLAIVWGTSASSIVSSSWKCKLSEWDTDSSYVTCCESSKLADSESPRSCSRTVRETVSCLLGKRDCFACS